MFVLIEPFKFEYLEDKPDLGCANIISSLNKNHIKNRLIQGQTKFFHDFLSNPKEFLELFFKISNENIKKLNLNDLDNLIREQGEKEFKKNLREYHRKIVEKNKNFFLNISNLLELYYLFNSYISLYKYFIFNKSEINLNFIKNYVKIIKNKKPDFIGFSLWQLEPFTKIIRKKIKEDLDIPLIGGGPIISHLRKENLNEFMNNYKFDYLIEGEGEQVLPLLLDKINKNKSRIPNLIYSKDKKIHFNRYKLCNLNSLPFPDFSQFDLDKYYNIFKELPIQTNRGCSWGKCAFCDHHINYKNKFRIFNLNYIINNLNYLSEKYKTNYFSLHDEHIPAKIARDFSKELIKRKYNFYLSGYARFEYSFLEKNTFKLMYKAGFRSLSWGLESGSQKVLNLMNKGINLKDMSKILEKSTKEGIKNTCFVFMGFPGEYFNDFKKTIFFLEKNKKYIHYLLSGRFNLTDNMPMSLDSKKIIIKNKNKFTDSVDFKYKFIPLHIKKYKKVLILFDSGILDLFDDYYRCVYLSHSERTIIHDLSILGILNKKKINKILNQQKINKLYPVVLGKILKKRKEEYLKTIDHTKSIYINDQENFNLLLSEKEKEIYRLIQKDFITENIIKNLKTKHKLSFKKSKSAVLGFYKKLFNKKSIMFYYNK